MSMISIIYQIMYLKNETLEDEEETTITKPTMAGYQYLVGMPIRSLTEKKINLLKAQRDKQLEKYNTLKNKTKENLWQQDLDDFQVAYLEMMATWEKSMSDEIPVKGVSATNKKIKLVNSKNINTKVTNTKTIKKIKKV
jgi:DNA topoisomerase II